MRRKHHWRYQGHFTRLASLSRSLTAPSAAGLPLALATLLVITTAQGNAQEPCPGGGYDPTPTAVAVTAVPIVVASTAAEYFVLYVSHEVGGTMVEIPVLVKHGAAGTTMLAENVEALPKERYRVEKYLVADPADVDGDCIDDISELADPVGMNPVNPAAAIEFSDGVVVVPDRETFEGLSYQGTRIDPNLADFEVVKFILVGLPGIGDFGHGDVPGVYFQNTETHQLHSEFVNAVGLSQIETGRQFYSSIVYHPRAVAPDGSLGVYSVRGWFAFYSCGHVDLAYTALAASMPLLEDNLVFYVPPIALPNYQDEIACYEASRIPLVFVEDISPETGFLALNPGEGYGLLRAMDPDDRPHPRNIVIYEALPNELPRVAGIITTVPQTPLSHVNLRAVQNGIPNAYIRDVLDDPVIAPLLGSFVRYEVTGTGWDLRPATPEEVDAHYESSRPARDQTPEFDLSAKEITSLSEIGFEDWKAFGVKAANVAVLGKLGFPPGTVPDGFAIPFYFYDEFMKHNGFYDDIEEMLADPDFQTDFEVQDDMLDDLRDDIEDAETPEWIIAAIVEMNKGFPEGINRRYRSSTNNEDLPGFNGAGLYDSKSQKPSEDEEDLAKSLKEVYASLWNFRAFVERDFHRIDHLAAKMGVLVHPSYQDELANGVAVSFDPILEQDGYYYVNTQLGEDLVTNPEAQSVPEEILLSRDTGDYKILSLSNLVDQGTLLMSDAQLTQLSQHLTVIHDHFERLYNPAPGKPFAMEIEFKITSDNILAIKQARPWVFSDAQAAPPPPPPPPPPRLPLLLLRRLPDRPATAGAMGAFCSHRRRRWICGRCLGTERCGWSGADRKATGVRPSCATSTDSRRCGESSGSGPRSKTAARVRSTPRGIRSWGLATGRSISLRCGRSTWWSEGPESEAVEAVMPLDRAYWSNFRGGGTRGEATESGGVFPGGGAFGGPHGAEVRGGGCGLRRDELDGEGEVTATRMGGYGYRYTSRTTGRRVEPSLDLDGGRGLRGAADLQVERERAATSIAAEGHNRGTGELPS